MQHGDVATVAEFRRTPEDAFGETVEREHELEDLQPRTHV
jgi:hypothetical protein